MKVCPRCGESNSERARFCQNCGYPFPEREAVGEERKTVTVVFCDLVGVHRPLRPGGPRGRQGDAAPVPRPRSSGRSSGSAGPWTSSSATGDGGVRCAGGARGRPASEPVPALRIQEAIVELNQANDAAPPLSVRIGVATGEAVVAFGAGPQIGEAVTGDVVNTASRIADVGGTGPGRRRRRHVRGHLRDHFESRGDPGGGQGEGGAAPVWRAGAPRSRPRRGPPRPVRAAVRGPGRGAVAPAGAFPPRRVREQLGPAAGHGDRRAGDRARAASRRALRATSTTSPTCCGGGRVAASPTARRALLGARRDGQGARRHPRVGRARASEAKLAGR